MKLNRIEKWTLKTIFAKNHNLTLDDIREEFTIKRLIARKYPNMDAIQIDAQLTTQLIHKGYLIETIESGQLTYHTTLKCLKYLVENVIFS